jgi:hypothetical protein
MKVLQHFCSWVLVLQLSGLPALLAQPELLSPEAFEQAKEAYYLYASLGWTGAAAVRSVALGGITLAAIGAVTGGLLSIPATSLVRSFLWRVDVNDPWTYAGVAVALFVVATVASVLPALRLLRLNPAETLRN